MKNRITSFIFLILLALMFKPSVAVAYYDPELGRFIQPDTIIPDLSNPQSYNRYSYVMNNPLRYTDPSGHQEAESEGEITREIRMSIEAKVSSASSRPLTTSERIQQDLERTGREQAIRASGRDPSKSYIGAPEQPSRRPTGKELAEYIRTHPESVTPFNPAEIGKGAATAAKADPAQLRLPPTRSEGADPFKLSKQIGQYGKSTEGMPPIEVTKGAKGEMMINDGVTRATRAAMTPGTKVPVQVIEHNPTMNLQNLPKVGEKLP